MTDLTQKELRVSVIEEDISDIPGIVYDQPDNQLVRVFPDGSRTPVGVGGAGPPTGAAGGDLGMTYPNPEVLKIRTVPVDPTGGATGDVLTQQIDGSFSPAPPSSSLPTGPAGGDLSGTFPNPGVAKVAGRAVVTAAGAPGDVLTQQGDGSYAPVTPAATTGGTVTSVAAEDATVIVGGTPTIAPTLHVATLDVLATLRPPAAAVPMNAKKITGLANGTVATDAAAFGQIPTNFPPSGAAGGDLASTFPNPTVAKVGGVSVTLGAGVEGDVLTQQHDGSFAPAPPTGGGGGGTVTSVVAADGTLIQGGVDTVNPSFRAASLDVIAGITPMSAALPMNAKKITGLANGSASTDAAAFGQIPTTLPPNGAAGGSLGGTYPNPSVAKVQAVAVSGTPPTAGQVLTALTGTTAQWAAPPPAAVSSVFGRTGAVVATNGDYTPAQVGALAANAALGGDLSGNAPTPTVRAIEGVVSNAVAPTAGQVLTALTAATMHWATPPSTLPPSGAAGGDLSGTFPNPGVAKIQGRTVSATAPVAGQVYQWSGTQWVPGTIPLQLTPTAVKTVAYAANPADLVVCNATSSFTVTLPAAPADKSTIGVKLVGVTGIFTVTVACGGADVFDISGGSTTTTMAVVGKCLIMQYAAGPAIWYIVAGL